MPNEFEQQLKKARMKPVVWERDYSKPYPAMKKKAAEPEPKVPDTAWKAIKMGLEDAKLSLQQMGQAAVNAVVSDKTLPDKEERAKAVQKHRDEVNEKRDQFDGGGGVGGFLTEAAVRLPGNLVKTAGEVYSPSKKVQAINAAYHGTRKYAETGDLTQAATAAATNLIGEKLEDKAGPLLKKIHSKAPDNIAGNAIGMVLENAADFFRGKKDEPAPPVPKPAPPVPKKPQSTSTPAFVLSQIDQSGQLSGMLNAGKAFKAQRDKRFQTQTK